MLEEIRVRLDPKSQGSRAGPVLGFAVCREKREAFGLGTSQERQETC